MIENVENEQMYRLCAPGTHEGKRFNKRLNFFLMFESVLLVVIGVLLSRPTTSKMILLTFMCFGLVLTIVWGYVQAKQKSVSRRIEGAPDDQVTVLKPEQVKWPGSSTSLFTYGLPLFVAVVWVVLLIVAATP